MPQRPDRTHSPADPPRAAAPGVADVRPASDARLMPALPPHIPDDASPASGVRAAVAVAPRATKPRQPRQPHPPLAPLAPHPHHPNQPPHQPIPAWPVAERPRERLMAQGAAALSDAELLAVLVRTGMQGATAVDIGRALLAEHGGLAPLLAQPPARLARSRGLGPAKAVMLHAAVELARRAVAEELRHADALGSPAAVARYLSLWLRGRDIECFVVLYLDARNRVIRAREHWSGTLTQTAVHPREIVRCALDANAAGVILAHNHPSGTAEPSAADRHLTGAVRDACALVDVSVLDHVIVAGARTWSFAAHGAL